MAKKLSKNQLRQRRHLRVRKHISGTPERPRLNVFRSLSNIYAQIIDDTTEIRWYPRLRWNRPSKKKWRTAAM